MCILIGYFGKMQYGNLFCVTLYGCSYICVEFVDKYLKRYSNNLQSPHNAPSEFAICHSVILHLTYLIVR